MTAPHAQNAHNPGSKADRRRSDNPEWAAAVERVSVPPGSYTAAQILRQLRSVCNDPRQVLAFGEGTRWVWYMGMWHVGKVTQRMRPPDPPPPLSRDPAIEERRKLAAIMYAAGKSFREIARELGTHHSVAHDDIRAVMARKETEKQV